MVLVTMIIYYGCSIYDGYKISYVVSPLIVITNVTSKIKTIDKREMRLYELSHVESYIVLQGGAP